MPLFSTSHCSVVVVWQVVASSTDIIVEAVFIVLLIVLSAFLSQFNTSHLGTLYHWFSCSIAYLCLAANFPHEWVVGGIGRLKRNTQKYIRLRKATCGSLVCVNVILSIGFLC